MRCFYISPLLLTGFVLWNVGGSSFANMSSRLIICAIGSGKYGDFTCPLLPSYVFSLCVISLLYLRWGILLYSCSLGRSNFYFVRRCWLYQLIIVSKFYFPSLSIPFHGFKCFSFLFAFLLVALCLNWYIPSFIRSP